MPARPMIRRRPATAQHVVEFCQLVYERLLDALEVPEAAVQQWTIRPSRSARFPRRC